MTDQDRRSGIDRRGNSECPLTAEQAYQILNSLGQSAKLQEKICSQQTDILTRLEKIDKYIFAGRVVFWLSTTCAVFIAWLFDLGNSVKAYFK